MTSNHRAGRCVLLLASVLLSACLDRPLKPLSPCLVSGVTVSLSVTKVDKVDLLFMVDNSNSMAEEQAALREQFPRLIEVLTTGDPGGGKPMFPPAKDLHLGVVSSDLGLPGGGLELCDGFGDDGLLQHDPRLEGCKASYPPFLSYQAKVQTPAEAASDFACIAMLGTGGCGIEQQLESTLKALWPTVDPMPKDGENRIQFLMDANGFGQSHGDTEHIGFMRNDPGKGLSLLAVIVVTDEEDCSTFDPVAFGRDSPFQDEGPNVRCSLHPEKLYPESRYVQALKLLRPNNPELVVFAAIVGVPPDTVSPEVLAQTDFANEAQREAFYQRISAHPAMQLMIDTKGTDTLADDQMRSSCQSAIGGVAYPPHRIVEVARGFGKNGIVQSICQDSFEPAIDAIIEVIGANLGEVCLPKPLVRNAQGIVKCDVVWELPPPGQGPIGTPETCNDPDRPFLLPPLTGEETKSRSGGARCRVAQLGVQGEQPMPTATEGTLFADGWFYDDFSKDTDEQCRAYNPRQRVAYTAAASPPGGVTIKLECLNETQRLESDDPGVVMNMKQPAIGDACGEVDGMPADHACVVKLSSGALDQRMFCHADTRACVRACNSSTECPDSWVCDQRPDSVAAAGGRSYCVNPTCGS